MNALSNFLSQEAGQRRTKWLNDTISDNLRYFLGPTGLPERIEGVMSMTPAAGVQESIAGTRTALDDTLSNEDRIDGLLRAGLGIGTTVAPAAAARLMPTVPGASLSDDFARNAAAVEDSFLGYGRDFTASESGAIDIDAIRSQFPDVKISVTGSPDRGYTLNRIEVPEGGRNSGVGTAVMDEITRQADMSGARVALSPSGDFGGTPSRLKRFYERFGFVNNKGANKDFEVSEDMYRLPQDPASTRGDDILSLLSEGRGSDVTDEMLDLGDPALNARLNEYLYNNYDLPMDEASRMGRAGEMGLRPGQYRGSRTDQTTFDENPIGRNFVSIGPPDGYEVQRAGTFFSDNPEFAGEYASTLTNNGNVITPEGAVVGEYNTPRSQPLPYPDDVSRELRFTPRGWEMLDDDAGQMVREYAEAQPNFRGAYEFEEWADTLKGDREIGGNTSVVFDPSNIRSRFARFDPRLSHLRNLSAGVGALGMISAGTDKEDKNALSGYLRERGL